MFDRVVVIDGYRAPYYQQVVEWAGQPLGATVQLSAVEEALSWTHDDDNRLYIDWNPPWYAMVITRTPAPPTPHAIETDTVRVAPTGKHVRVEAWAIRDEYRPVFTRGIGSDAEWCRYYESASDDDLFGSF